MADWTPPTTTVHARAEIAVWDSGGNGPPVLLLHGFPDHPLGLEPLSLALERSGRRVIRPALPGYPPSQPVPGADYDLERVASDLLVVLDAVDVERAAVVGHDWGASLAYRLGALWPDRVTHVIALAAPHDAGFARRRASLAELQRGAYATFLAFVDDASRLAADRRWLTALTQLASPSLYRADLPAILDLLADESTMAEICAYYRCDLASGGGHDRVHVPTTVIYGVDDGVIGPSLFEGLEDWFPCGLRRHPLQGAGHWPHLERGAETLAIVREALAGGG